MTRESARRIGTTTARSGICAGTILAGLDSRSGLDWSESSWSLSVIVLSLLVGLLVQWLLLHRLPRGAYGTASPAAPGATLDRRQEEVRSTWVKDRAAWLGVTASAIVALIGCGLLLDSQGEWTDVGTLLTVGVSLTAGLLIEIVLRRLLERIALD